jgi:hypothetical protein
MFNSALCVSLRGLMMNHITLAQITCLVTALSVIRVLICFGFNYISYTIVQLLFQQNAHVFYY